MASYGSISTASELNGGGADTLLVTKPTGLAVGDLMLCIIGIVQNAGNGSISGWTQILSTSDGGNYGMIVLYKIADSADVAASDFTISYNAGGGDPIVAAIVRATGTFTSGANIQITSDINTAATTTHTFTPGLTPRSTSDLLILGSLGRNSGSQSGYSITNNNPTWTERADILQSATGDDANLAVATATASAASDTGDYSVTLNTSAEALGYLIVVSDTTNVTVSPTVISVTTTVQAPAVSGSATVTVSSAVSVTTSVQAPTVTFPVSDWTDQTKNTTTWTDQAKS